MSSTYVKSRQKSQAMDQSLSLPQVVINTRPLERAAPLTHHLQAAGLTVVDMPMLSLQSRPVTDNDRTLMGQWLTGDYKALVIVSPTAAAAGLAVWQSLVRELKSQGSTAEEAETGLETLKTPSPIIAVGAATAAVLSRAKLDTTSYRVRQPDVANNEGMLAMPEIKTLQAGDKLLIWRGLGGRRLLVDTLQARGVHIDSIAWYERTMPTEAATQYQQWLQDFLAHRSTQVVAPSKQPKQSKPIVVISSGTAFEHWTTIVTAAATPLTPQSDSVAASSVEPHKVLTLSDFAYVVLGERLANMVAEQQLSHWRVEDLAPETILAAIKAKN